MTESEIKQGSNQFDNFENTFVDRGTSTKPKKESSPEKFVSEESQFLSKGTNRKLDEPYNIHFTIGGGTFNNLISFINEIGYDVAFLFRKKEMYMIAVDSANTHTAIVKFSKIEFSDYMVKGLENDEDEKGVLIDISVIIEKLNMRDETPIDFYLDTEEKNRFYVISGKDKIERQLASINTTDGIGALLQRYRNFLGTVNRLVSNTNYQKIVINQIPLTILISSLKKKISKNKGETLFTVFLTKHNLDWSIKDETESYSSMLSGDDIMVYPLEDDRWQGNLEFFNKFGKLKLSLGVAMYICGYRTENSLPLIFETKLGGNGIVVHYMIAPRIDESYS